MNLILFFGVAVIGVISFITPGVLMAQTMEAPIPTLRSPADFPELIVTPRENLDPTALSTLSRSTLSRSNERISNLAVNEIMAQDEENQIASIFIDRAESYDLTYSPLPLVTKGKFYRWIDENGVIHVTNRPDSIPSA